MKPFPSGLGVALVTPFQDNGAIDFPALDALVDYADSRRCGRTWWLSVLRPKPRLSLTAERKAVLERIKSRNAGRPSLVAGIGGNDTAAVVAALHDFDLAGVDAILSVTPFYNRPSQRGLYEHFRAVADASPVPVILYNVPSRTGVNVATADYVETCRRDRQHYRRQGGERRHGAGQRADSRQAGRFPCIVGRRCVGRTLD